MAPLAPRAAAAASAPPPRRRGVGGGTALLLLVYLLAQRCSLSRAAAPEQRRQLEEVGRQAQEQAQRSLQKPQMLQQADESVATSASPLRELRGTVSEELLSVASAPCGGARALPRALAGPCVLSLRVRRRG